MVEVRPFDDVEDRAWRALVHVADLLPRHLDNEMEDARRISVKEFAILLHLSESQDSTLRMSTLAADVGLSPSRTTRVVETLRRRGWIQKSPDASDGRATTVAITDSGRAQVGPAYDVQVEGARRILFDHITREDAEQLARVLRRLSITLAREDRFD
ncbi:MarR family winged helix-turn-helix transcriptional regulator [Leifsonia sp. NPDC056665]|uniref:MarR family winged helix-turn-helix transcriptional regulator n=1 Tax=Leifsonia sp. NPDC056665 TaxID=3345901 RepID=UPI0036A5C59B